MNSRWKIGLIGLMGLILLLSGILVFSADLLQGEQPTEPEPGEEDWIRVKGRINILLLGTDEDIGTNSRTDTIMLASLDTENNKISLLSIPRDTRVTIPGYGENKINSANLLGGVDLLKETISELLKVPIDYYVITNFDGFKGIVDTLGGVEIDVEQNMKYRVYDGMIDIKKGLQRLDGDKALQYVRFRHDKLGDISRTQRQQKFLSALAKEMMQAKNIIKLPALIPKLREAVETDLSITQMIALAKNYGNYDVNSITVQTLPGNFVDINGGSYWYVDTEKAHQVVLEVFAGKQADIIDTNIKVNIGSSKTQKPVIAAPKPEASQDPEINDKQNVPSGDNGVNENTLPRTNPNDGNGEIPDSTKGNGDADSQKDQSGNPDNPENLKENDEPVPQETPIENSDIPVINNT